MKAITVRNIEKDLEHALKKKRLETGKSVNSIILESLNKTLLGRTGARKEFAELDHLAGTWTESEEKEFLSNTAPFSEIDGELWK